MIQFHINNAITWPSHKIMSTEIDKIMADIIYFWFIHHTRKKVNVNTLHYGILHTEKFATTV